MHVCHPPDAASREAFVSKMVCIIRRFCPVCMPVSSLAEGQGMARAHTKDILLVQFGRRVWALRKAARLSQEKLAFQSDLDRSYIGQVERGECNISLKNIGKLAQALDVAPAELFHFPRGDTLRAASPDHGKTDL